MPNIYVVTDSSARFANSHYVQQHRVSVVPNKISIAGKDYREGIDLTPEEAIRLMANLSFAPKIVPATTTEYVEVYKRLARTADGIISIHASRELYSGWHNARAAARQLAGSCHIEVIDSHTICAAQAMLVRVAIDTIQSGAELDDVIKTVRGAIERIYSMYYVESIGYLLQNKVMSGSHTILGTLLGIKPFLTVEEGELRVVEKVRTRTQAVERLVEFVTEFEDVQDAVILQNKTHMTEQTRMLQDRLALEFPGRHFPYTVYGASMGVLIGADATGVVVLEGETEIEFDDDF